MNEKRAHVFLSSKTFSVIDMFEAIVSVPIFLQVPPYALHLASALYQIETVSIQLNIEFIAKISIEDADQKIVC